MWIGIHRQSSAACLNPHAHTNRTQKKQRTENNIRTDKHSITLCHCRGDTTHTPWQEASRVRVNVRHFQPAWTWYTLRVITSDRQRTQRR